MLCVALCWHVLMCVDVYRHMLHGVASYVLHCVGAIRRVSTCVPHVSMCVHGVAPCVLERVRACWCVTVCVDVHRHVSTNAP